MKRPRLAALVTGLLLEMAGVLMVEPKWRIIASLTSNWQ